MRYALAALLILFLVELAGAATVATAVLDTLSRPMATITESLR